MIIRVCVHWFLTQVNSVVYMHMQDRLVTPSVANIACISPDASIICFLGLIDALSLSLAIHLRNVTVKDLGGNHKSKGLDRTKASVIRGHWPE